MNNILVPFFYPNLPSIIGHRGAYSSAPENTLIAIRKAAQLGAKWVEIDVRLSSDKVPVIFHDDEVNRTTNCLLYTSPSPRDGLLSRMPSSA